MKYNRKKTIFAIFVLLFVAISASILTSQSTQKKQSIYHEPLAAAPLTDTPLKGMQEQTWEVDETFETHLPIVIIDTENERPPISMSQDEDGIFWPIPNVEPYRSGNLKIIDTGGMNHLTDQPSEESLIQIKRRGNSSMLYEKAQYLIKLVTESGQDRYLDFFNMGSEREWVLNGSMADKSMVRNYLALRMGDQVLPYTPESVYTEVIYHENGRYYYEGVHLLMENIKQGEKRVAIEPAAQSDAFPSYIARRDRIGEDEIILDTWATREGLSFNHLGLIYPSRNNATQKEIDYVTEDLSQIEKILYSDYIDIFSTYSRYIDVPSFIDYFLLNEYFGSYDAGINSTYMYKDKGQKLKMGPIWDFDGTMDNFKEEPLDYQVTAFQVQPWFDRLIKDKQFIEQMQKRYAELRQGVFSDENFTQTVDAIEDHLGPAIDREWARWGHIYTQPTRYDLENFGKDKELVRDASEYRVEMYRLKTAVLKHSSAIGSYLETLKKSTVVDSGVNYYMPLILLIAVLGFALPAYYASRK